jgi:plasmid stabilization system protein ParE
VKRYAILIPGNVQEQIAAQVLHIAQDSIDNALAWEDRLHKAMQVFNHMPGFAVDEDASERLGITVRRYIFERSYLIHFIVDDAAGAVRIVNFRHGARLPRTDEP